MARQWLSGAQLCDGRVVDIGIDDGVIVSIDVARSDPDDTTETFDMRGRLVLPLLVNGHAHLDKTFFGGRWQPHMASASVREQITYEKRLRYELEETAYSRARALAMRMVEYGTGYMRAHVDIDTQIGLTGLDRMLRLREELDDLLDIQIVAFPQSGIVAEPGVKDLLDEALRLGGDIVGGVDPDTIDADIDGHLDAVFDLAVKWSVGVDMHLHASGEIALREYDAVIDHTVACGMQGRVTISHAFGLGLLSGPTREHVFDQMAENGISVMTNGPVGAMPPVLDLRRRGVNVFAGTDNVQDAWWPYGSGDPLESARNVAIQSGFRTDDDLLVALGMVTNTAADALALSGYGIVVGHRADLLVVDAQNASAALAAPPDNRDVMRGGEWISHRSMHVCTQSPKSETPSQQHSEHH